MDSAHPETASFSLELKFRTSNASTFPIACCGEALNPQNRSCISVAARSEAFQR